MPGCEEKTGTHPHFLARTVLKAGGKESDLVLQKMLRHPLHLCNTGGKGGGGSVGSGGHGCPPPPRRRVGGPRGREAPTPPTPGPAPRKGGGPQRFPAALIRCLPCQRFASLGPFLRPRSRHFFTNMEPFAAMTSPPQLPPPGLVPPPKSPPLLRFPRCLLIASLGGVPLKSTPASPCPAQTHRPSSPPTGPWCG